MSEARSRRWGGDQGMMFGTLQRNALADAMPIYLAHKLAAV